MKKNLLAYLLLAYATSLDIFAAPNSIIALVNDGMIMMDSIQHQIKSNNTKEQKLALLNQQIDLMLKLQAIKRIGIEPKNTSVNAALKSVAEQNQLTLKQLQLRPEFNQIVKNVKQKMSMRGLMQFALRDVEFNPTEDEIRANIAKQPSSPPNQQIKIAQILINSIDNTDLLTRSQDQLIQDFLLNLSRKINNGESFSALAKLHSQDPSYRNGGESGWIDSDKLSDLFKQHLKPGKLSKPFKTKQGWRIVKIIDSRETDDNLTAVRNQLIRKKQTDYFNNWVKDLRKDAYIEIFDHKF